MQSRTARVEIEGSGTIKAKGKIDDLNIQIEGSGDADFGQVTSRNARVEIGGHGDVHIAPSEEAKIEISGSGDVYLHSNPKRLDTEIGGSGRIHKVGRSSPASDFRPLTSTNPRGWDYVPPSMANSLQIGDVTIPGRVLTAPMTGVSDLPFRRIASRCGAAYVATEMVACDSFARGRPDVVRRAAVGDGLPLTVIQLVGRDAGMDRQGRATGRAGRRRHHRFQYGLSGQGSDRRAVRLRADARTRTGGAADRGGGERDLASRHA